MTAIGARELDRDVMRLEETASTTDVGRQWLKEGKPRTVTCFRDAGKVLC